MNKPSSGEKELNSGKEYCLSVRGVAERKPRYGTRPLKLAELGQDHQFNPTSVVLYTLATHGLQRNPFESAVLYFR